MSIQELVVRFQDNIWQVRLGDHLLSGQPTQMAALSVARTIAHAAAARGARSKILVVDVDGSSIEFPVIEPQGPPAADVA
jgi:type IV pilus biogenesis protein CpaD/CtpE